MKRIIKRTLRIILLLNIIPSACYIASVADKDLHPIDGYIAGWIFSGLFALIGWLLFSK